jgi:arsenate reductase
MKTVTFACVHSAGRSQMAAAWFNQLADPLKAKAVAAGTQPADRIHPEVIEAMREVGLDLSSAKPQLLTGPLVAETSFLITMGCGEACPTASQRVRRFDWELDDPKGKPVERVREIREEIKGRVQQLISEQGWTR